MNAILTIAGHQWRLFWADKRAAWLCFAVPILLASAFGIIFDRPMSTTAAMKLPVLIVCETDNAAVRDFVQELSGSSRFEATLASSTEAERLVADRRPGIAILFDSHFEMPKGLSAGQRPRLQILHHPLCKSESQWAEGVVTEAMMQRLAKQTLGPLASRVESPVEMQTVAVNGSAGFNAYSHSFSGMTLQYLLFWGMESGLLFLRERQRGVWQRMRTSPVSLATLLLGKAFATAMIALLIILTTFGFGRVAFGVQVSGSFTGFLLLAVVMSTLAAATGLLVAAIGGTEARARSICILGILGVSMLGGLWLPAFLLPGWARDLALALPTTWAMRGLDAVTWQGRDFAALVPSAAAVLAFTVLFLGVAILRLKAQESRRRLGWSA
ncbi:hypothetical protein BH11PLA2_BH11PLA2_33280 [soil metagenome]